MSVDLRVSGCTYDLARREEVAGRMRGCRHAAADQEEREEQLEGGHGAAEAQGGKFRSHQVETHECRKHAAGDMTREGKEGGSSLRQRYLCPAIQKGLFASRSTQQLFYYMHVISCRTGPPEKE